MMITADQIVAHLVGDYLLQSDWMATEKTKESLAAAVHALTYALPFLFFRPSLAAFAFIVITHCDIAQNRLRSAPPLAIRLIGQRGSPRGSSSSPTTPSTCSATASR